MVFSKSTTIYLWFCFFLVFSACISDNYDSCYGVRLAVNYPNDQHRCEKLDIFVFDHQGNLFANYEKSGRQVQPGVTYLLQVPEGQYSIVVWGDVMGEYTYDEIDVLSILPDNQSKVENYPQISDFWRYLVKTKLENVTRGNLPILSRELKPLYHSSEYRVELKPKETKTLQLDLMKNTNKVQIKVSGLPEGTSYEKLDIGVTARNWQYNFMNTVPQETEEVRYLPYSSQVEVAPTGDEKMKRAMLSVLRLIKGRSPLIYIKDGETGHILYQRNLVELLLNLPYTDLDKEDDYVIELDFRGPTIAIKINGWDIVDNNQDIS